MLPPRPALPPARASASAGDSTTNAQSSANSNFRNLVMIGSSGILTIATPTSRLYFVVAGGVYKAAGSPFRAKVDHSLGLADGALDAAERRNLDFGGDPDHRLD